MGIVTYTDASHQQRKNDQALPHGTMESEQHDGATGVFVCVHSLGQTGSVLVICECGCTNACVCTHTHTHAHTFPYINKTIRCFH